MRPFLSAITQVFGGHRTLTAGVLLIMSLAAFPGCSGGSGGGSPIAPYGTTIGPAGGTVTDNGGSSVTIPPGALGSNVAITVKTLPEKDDLPTASQTFLPLLGGAQFGPSGTNFAVPVTITIPLDPPLGAGETASVLFWNETDESWSAVDGPVTVAPDGRSVSAEVDHFSLFSAVGDVFNNFHANFGDGPTAESAFTSYCSWFKSNVTSIGRKGIYKGDCHKIVGLRIGLGYDVQYFPDGPNYQGTPYMMEGESSDRQVAFDLQYEHVLAGVVDMNYDLEVYVFLECCAPEAEVTAEPASIGTGETSRVTANVMCDDEAMEGRQVTFESLGGLGDVSPASASLSSGGTATTTFTAGEDEGIESVRASLSTCDGQETPDGAAQIEISDDWSGTMDVTFTHNIGDEPLFTFTDDVAISFDLTIEKGVVSGTGTGTHSVHLATAGNCDEQSMSAPEFTVTVTGAAVGGNLEFTVVPTDMSIDFTLLCHWDEDDTEVPYPIFGLLESAIMAMDIFVDIPWQDGGTDSGSGSESFGEDIPILYSYSVTLSAP